MNLSVSVNLDNAAFEDPEEVINVIVQAAEKIRNHGMSEGEGRLKDSNGNTVGKWEIR